MIRASSLAVVGLATLVCLGCETVGDLRQASLYEGVPREYHAGYKEVLPAAQEAVMAAGLQIVEVSNVSEGTSMILAENTTSAWSWGELVRVVVETTGPESTTVRVLTKRRLATNITATSDFSPAILSILDLKLRRP